MLYIYLYVYDGAEIIEMYLLGRYPSFRVAYIDEVEAPSQDRNKKIDKVYYSVLVKAAVTKSNDPGQSLDQVLQNALFKSVWLWWSLL